MTAALHAWRLAAWDTPLWVNPNRAAGRFNEEGTGPVQYWSLHPLTPWAEYLRAHAITSRERLRELRLRLWVARFHTKAERIGFDNAPDYGLSAEDLVADDRAACQGFGARCLAGEGPGAIDVPSAALAGTRNLVLFGPLVASPFAAAPVDGIDVPTTVAADHARPLDGLLPLVRHIGEPHAELVAWAEQRAFAFTEPAAPMP